MKWAELYLSMVSSKAEAGCLVFYSVGSPEYERSTQRITKLRD